MSKNAISATMDNLLTLTGDGKNSVLAKDRRFDTVRQLRTPVWVYDIDKGRVVLANAAAVTLWQAESEQALRSRNLVDGMSRAVYQRLLQYQNDFINRNAVFTESWTLYPKGHPTTVMLVFSGYKLPDGRMGMMCEGLEAPHELPENMRSRDALMHADVMIMLFSENGPPVYMNPAARGTFDPNVANFRELFVSPEVFDDLIVDVVSKGEKRTVAKMLTEEGLTWYDISVKRCNDVATGEPSILVTAIDVNELKTARDTAHHLATRDQLTDCYNRSYLNRKLESLLHSKSTVKVGLLYIDLDRFKQINDNFGHAAGDTVLKQTADRIKLDGSSCETLARLGGDEFVLLIEQIDSRNALLARADEILNVFQDPIICGTTRLRVTASLGGVIVSGDLMDWSEAMRRADIALYQSKQSGRNRCCIFSDEMGRAATERVQIESDLAEAIKRDEFVLYYQPRVDISRGEVVSAEALVRWKHPTKGLLGPEHFIPICEETGMIEPLGELIIHKAGQQVSDWHKTGLDLGVSINVSPRQFQDKRLMESLIKISQLSHFPKGKVELEITETVLIGDVASIADRLNAIHELGFKIAIDDFGTGYSNLAYISSFPLNCIKIDKSFVDQLPHSLPIIELILTLAEQIGASVVAEGVESHVQLDLLNKSPCTEVQGFVFSKPVPACDIRSVVDEIEQRIRRE